MIQSAHPDKPPFEPRGRWLGRLPREVRVDLGWAVGVFACTVVAFLLLRYVPAVSLPVFCSLALAWILDPVVDRFEARGWSRSAAICLLGAVLLAVVGVILAWLVPALVEQLVRVPDYLAALAGRLLPLAERLLERPLPATWHELGAELSGKAAELVRQVGPAAGQVLVRAAGGTASVLSGVLGVALVPLFVFYFLRDFDRMTERSLLLVPPRHRTQVLTRMRAIDEVLAAFVRGQLTVALILGVIYAVGLTLSGVKLGLAIGLAAGVASLIPYVGAAFGAALAVVAVVVDWHDGSGWVAAGAAITFVVGQVLEGNVITPRIVGEKVGLPPVIVMLAVLAFGELLGFSGVVLAVPLAALLKVVLQVLEGHYRRSRWYVRRIEEGQREEKGGTGVFSA